MEYNTIEVEREEHLLIVTINRPEVMNALNPEAHREMAEAFDEFQSNPELWVAIVTGAGPAAFCAGGDISAMVGAKTDDDYKVPASGYGGLTSRVGCHKPIIAAVNGIAFGGGFEMALAADIVVASEHAQFALPEPKIGTAAVAGGMHRLVRQIGTKPAMAMLLTGDSVSARQAQRLGLVNEVVSADQVMAEARKYAAKILQCAPLAIQATKQCVHEGLAYADIDELQLAQAGGRFDKLNKMFHSSDIHEGLTAFMEKRKPVWKGE